MTLWGVVTEVEKTRTAPQSGLELQVDLEPKAELQSCLSEGVRSLYQRCQFYDLVVVAAGKRFPAHQVALAAVSPALGERVREARRLAAAPAEASAPGDAAEAQPPQGALPGHPELHLEDVGDPEAARALLDYVYGMEGDWQGGEEANRDVLRLAQRFGLPRLEERAARRLVEDLSSDNVVSRLATCEEFGLADLFDRIAHQLILSAGALVEVTQSDEVVKHPKVLQHLLIQAVGMYGTMLQVVDSPGPPSRSAPSSGSGSEGWPKKFAKATHRTAPAGA